jgi:hypothetical protein
MTFERVEALDEDDTYELIYKIDGLNRTYGELYGESKNTLFNNILNDDNMGKLNENAKPTIMKEYVSNQTTNTFMRHGVEKYFHEYIIVVDGDWYTPCEFISEFGLEDSFGPEYVFEQVVIAVKSSIKWLKNQGYRPDENGDDEAYNLWEMIDFVGSLKENTTENKNLFDNILNESAAYDAGKKAGKEGRKFNPYGLGDQDADDYADFEAGRQAGEAERSEGGNLREAARTRLSVELRQFVARFVYNMTACEAEGKDEDDLYDEYAELALKTANWCGLPEQVLPYLNYILSDDCLCCDMWKLINHIMKYLNSK